MTIESVRCGGDNIVSITVTIATAGTSHAVKYQCIAQWPQTLKPLDGIRQMRQLGNEKVFHGSVSLRFGRHYIPGDMSSKESDVYSHGHTVMRSSNQRNRSSSTGTCRRLWPNPTTVKKMSCHESTESGIFCRRCVCGLALASRIRNPELLLRMMKKLSERLIFLNS